MKKKDLFPTALLKWRQNSLIKAQERELEKKHQHEKEMFREKKAFKEQRDREKMNFALAAESAARMERDAIAKQARFDSNFNKALSLGAQGLSGLMDHYKIDGLSQGMNDTIQRGLDNVGFMTATPDVQARMNRKEQETHQTKRDKELFNYQTQLQKQQEDAKMMQLLTTGQINKELANDKYAQEWLLNKAKWANEARQGIEKNNIIKASVKDRISSINQLETMEAAMMGSRLSLPEKENNLRNFARQKQHLGDTRFMNIDVSKLSLDDNGFVKMFDFNGNKVLDTAFKNLLRTPEANKAYYTNETMGEIDKENYVMKELTNDQEKRRYQSDLTEMELVEQYADLIQNSSPDNPITFSNPIIRMASEHLPSISKQFLSPNQASAHELSKQMKEILAAGSGVRALGMLEKVPEVDVGQSVANQARQVGEIFKMTDRGTKIVERGQKIDINRKMPRITMYVPQTQKRISVPLDKVSDVIKDGVGFVFNKGNMDYFRKNKKMPN